MDLLDISDQLAADLEGLRFSSPVAYVYNPLVYDVADVLGTLVYRKGIQGGDFDFATAVGLFRSLISLVLVLGVNALAKRVRGESVL